MAFSDFRTKGFLALVGLTLLLRFGFLGSFDHVPVSDEMDYLELAASLAESRSYVIDGAPSAFRPPGYPVFLAVVQIVFGPAIEIIRVIQIFLDLGIVVGLYVLGLRYGHLDALLAGLIWALFPPAILYTGLILSETFAAFLLVALLVVLTLRPWPLGPVPSAVAGLLMGILVLVKAWVILFGAGIFCLLWIRTRSLTILLWFSAGILLIVAPWTMRNVFVFGSPLISTNTGINLYMGNNPHATGAYKAGLPDTLLAVSHDELAFHQLSLGMAINHIFEDPIGFVKRMPIKVAHTFRSEGELLVWVFHPNIRDRSSSFSQKYRSLSLILILGVNILYASVLLMGVAGVLRFWRDDPALITVLFFGILIAVHAVFFGGSRFHFLLMPLMTFFAARSLPNLHHAWTVMSFTCKMSFIVIAAIFLSVWILEFMYVF